jgi:peptidoglycan/xylan/chitin deacetylase (PgdA/CDA1 family)
MTLIALTFDDGTIHHLKVARLLNLMRIRATFFVITDLKVHPDNHKLLLTSNGRFVSAIAGMGHEIGSHSQTHRILQRLSDEELHSELLGSKQSLESLIGTSIHGFAYPYSLITERTRAAVSRVYAYARAGPEQGGIYQNNEFDKFAMGSIGVKKLAQLALTVDIRRRDLRVVIMLHDEPLSVLLPLVIFARTVLRAKFVTLTEFVGISAN